MRDIYEHFKYPMDEEVLPKHRKFTREAGINFYTTLMKHIELKPMNRLDIEETFIFSLVTIQDETKFS